MPPPSSSSSSTAFRNLPRRVQRELLRHVDRPPRSAAAAANHTGYNRRRFPTTARRNHGMQLTLTGSLLFFGVASSLPLLAWWWIDRLNDRPEHLTAAQIRRGAFNNSGSRDVGPDPDWDWEKGQHKYLKGYGEINPEWDQGGTNLATTTTTKETDNHEDLTAVARGLPPQAKYRQQQQEQQ